MAGRIGGLGREVELRDPPIVVLLGVRGASSPKERTAARLLEESRLDVGVRTPGAREAGVLVGGWQHIAEPVGTSAGGGVNGGGQHGDD